MSGDGADTTGAEGTEHLIQTVRERRLLTLALADQVAVERWHEAALPDGGTAHAMLAHLLAWDEWATAVFELSALRTLPEKLIRPMRDAANFDARAAARYAALSKEHLLAGLQGANMRLVSAATSVGGVAWAERRIPDLAPEPAQSDGQPSPGPTVAELLRMLRDNERRHDEEFAAAFGVSADLEQLRAQALGTNEQPAG